MLLFWTRSAADNDEFVQGGEAWERRRQGDATKDWPLLQQLSWELPEVFWPPVLRQLRILFHQPPSRCALAHPPALSQETISWLLNISYSLTCNRP